MTTFTRNEKTISTQATYLKEFSFTGEGDIMRVEFENIPNVFFKWNDWDGVEVYYWAPGGAVRYPGVIARPGDSLSEWEKLVRLGRKASRDEKVKAAYDALMSVAEDVEAVAPAPVEETNAAAETPAESARLDSGEGLNTKDRAARLTPQITAPGVYRLSHVVEINPLRLIVEDNAIYWGYEAAGEINPVQGLQAFEIAGDMTAALTKALKKFKAANASAKELAGWKTYA